MKNKSKSFATYLIIILMLVLTSSSLSLIGIFMGKVVTAISNLDMGQFKSNLLKLASLVLINFLSSNLAFRLNYRLGMEKFIYLKNELFKKDLENTGEINIANYTTNIENIYANRFMVKINTINLALTMFFAVISIIYINYKLLPVAVIGASLPLLIPLFLGKKIQRKSQKFNEFYDFYQKYIGKKLEQKNEYLRYKVEDKLIEEKSKIEFDHEKNRKDLKNINNFSNISSQALGSISYILIFIFGGYLAFKGEIEVGSIISVVQLMNYIVDPVIALSSLISLYNESRPIYENIKKLLDEKQKGKKAFGLTYPINLFAKNISFAYEDKKIIEDFNYEFSYGKKYLIKGESGKGKSTLAKILCGEISPDKGEILLNGLDIKDFDFRDYILYVDQKPTIIDGNLEDNIKFYRNKLDNKIDLNLFNINKKLSDKVSANDGISGGEMMRISLLRSLLNPRDIMIYDEPIASLDDYNSKIIIERLLSLKQTVIIISHKMTKEDLEKFDEIIDI